MRNQIRNYLIIGFAIILLIFVAACSKAEGVPQSELSPRLKIVVTTTFIGDVIHQVAGDIPEITVLLEPGQNPHSYQLTPQDMVKVTEADAVFVNGFGLEEFLDDLMDGTETEAELVVVSEGIDPLVTLDHPHEGEDHDDDHDGEDHEGEDHEGEDHDDHEHGEGNDPHVWFDPNNLIIWTENIVHALSELDPDHTSDYQANGNAYTEELISLDGWIRTQVERIPEVNRKLVTDHTLLGYFAEEYGFVQIGAVIPAMTTEVESSGQEMAKLIDTILENQVKVIFIGIDFDPAMAEMVAKETGIELIPLYFGSLSAGEPAGTYLDFMRYDVNAIISALE